MLLHLLCYSIAVFMACSVRHSSYSTILAVGALMLILVPELADFGVPGFLSFFTMWRDGAVGSSQLIASGYPQLWQTGVLAVACLCPAFILVGAIVIPTTLAAAYLVKRDISVSS